MNPVCQSQGWNATEPTDCAGRRAVNKIAGVASKSRLEARMPVNMSVKTIGSVLVFGIVAAVSSGAGAGPSGFRCPTTGRLVSVGQSQLEVRNRCGDPDETRPSVEVRTVRETVRQWVNGVAHEVTVERSVEIAVDEWTYDFGRHRFIQFLHFESGRLVLVLEGGKGVSGPD